MITLFRHHIPIATVAQLLADCVLLFLAALLAMKVALPASAIGDTATFTAALYASLAVTIGVAAGLYRRGAAPFFQLVGRVVLTLFVATGAAAVVLQWVPGGAALREVLGYVTLYALASLILSRQALLSARHAGIGRRPVLIVGTGEEALAVQAALSGGEASVVGFYQAGGAEAVVIDPAHPLFSNTDELCEVVHRMRVREIIVAVRDQRGGSLPLKQLLDCRISGVPVLDLAGFYEREHGQVPVESLKSSWLIYGQGFAQSRWRAGIKRTVDIVGSSFLLVLSAPLWLLAALAIVIDSGRPVLYRQERVGRGGRPFSCLKFRSMRTDAEQDGVARWASTGDSRITRVGRWLRKSRIDELPQLINVLRGDMSLIGPRPERPQFVAELAAKVPFYDVRHSVKPGITGWAQVRWRYGASIEDAKSKLQYDLYYVKNHSLFLDVLILLETVRVVLAGEGAR